ncbi:hypothetical protein BDA96_02G309200 [Sorghum bicolor]|uniref:Uncharacterized protein n=1 Tax=Sorghum bicolor TaxID=4558 RepID=A0A921RSB2_SORBI|nr:hypothetical protein BDA96_02G309200 [Sorghum bicolor]
MGAVFVLPHGVYFGLAKPKMVEAVGRHTNPRLAAVGVEAGAGRIQTRRVQPASRASFYAALNKESHKVFRFWGLAEQAFVPLYLCSVLVLSPYRN